MGLIWNQPDTEIDWVAAIANLIAPFEGDTPRYHKGDWQQALDTHTQFQLIGKNQFLFEHIGTVEHVVIQRILSTSFIATASAIDKAMLRHELEKIINTYLDLQLDEEIAFPYITHAYHYQKI